MIRKLLTSTVVAGTMAVSGLANALPVASNGANDSLGTAQDINGFFDLSANPQVEDATTIPHVEISNRSGDDTYDYYFFSVLADNSTAIFDIDCGFQDLGLPNTGCSDQDNFFDSYLDLYTSGGAFITSDDDDFSGDPGSENTPFDALLRTTLDIGDYVIRVGAFPGVEVPDEASYILNVSIGTPGTTVAAPGVVMLFGLGLLGLGVSRRRTR